MVGMGLEMMTLFTVFLLLLFTINQSKFVESVHYNFLQNVRQIDIVFFFFCLTKYLTFFASKRTEMNDAFK